MEFRPVILLLDPQQNQIAPCHQAMQLQAHGFDIAACTDMQQLYGKAREMAGHSGLQWVVVLAATLAANRIAATYLRTLYPVAGILALVASSRVTVLMQTLQSGADGYCPRNASPELLLASLLRLLWRAGNFGSVPQAQGAAGAVAAGTWALLEQGWVLLGPQQQRIPLTTGERAFLTTLLAAPGQRADHRRLVEAVNSNYDPVSGSVHPARLALLVSRLRRKLRAHGAEAPLKSVHRWGYMFTGRV